MNAAPVDRTDMILEAVQELQRAMQGLQSVAQDLRQELTADAASVKAEVTGLRTEWTGLKTEVTDLRVATMERMDRLQNTLTACRDDIAVNMGTSEAVRRANDNTREELRGLQDFVAQIWQQLKQLQQRVRGLSGDP